jgi:tetratricopeptide (TPR) repeat protein
MKLFPTKADATAIAAAEMQTMIARAELEQALVEAEAAHGPDHPLVAEILSPLGRFLNATGHVAQAEMILERALAIHERTHRPEATELAGPLGDLAMVKALSRPAEAVPLLRRALAIDERVFGAAHPGVAIRLSCLGMVLYDLGAAVEARPLLERALALSEQAAGPTSPEVAAALSNLALVLKALGAVGEAEALLERAVAITDAKPRRTDRP